MGWSNGTFTRTHDWTADEAGAIDIESVRMDQEDDNFAAGINNCLTKDGQNTPTGNLPMGSNRHTGVGNAVALTDYASAADVIDQHLTYYVDSGAADAYVITPSPAISAYAEGQRFVFRATNANTGAATLNVNALGAFAIETVDDAALVAGMIVAGGYYEVVYDANATPDRWVLVSPHSLSTQTSLTPTDSNFIVGNGTDWVAETGATARTSLGLGSIATQAASAVSITGGSISGITDLAVADGGTGASTASAARTSLGVAIGTDVQAFDAHLQDIANVNPPTQADQFLVSSGAGAYSLENASSARTSLGLGTLATQSTVDNGDWSGTDLAIANGGTGASTATLARTNLDVKAEIHMVGLAETIGNMANAEQFFPNASGGTPPVFMVDATNYTQVRMSGVLQLSAAATNSPRLFVKYKTGTWSLVIGNFTNIASTGSCEIDLTSSLGAVDSGWVDIASGAKAENVMIAVEGVIT